MVCPCCLGARHVKTVGNPYDVCKICDGLGDVSPIVDEEYRSTHAVREDFPEQESVTLVPCLKCLYCDLCGGKHLTTPERNAKFKETLHDKAVKKPDILELEPDLIEISDD